jgi:hypothetical protein
MFFTGTKSTSLCVKSPFRRCFQIFGKNPFVWRRSGDGKKDRTMQDARCKMQNVGYKMQDVGNEIHKAEEIER